MRDTIRFQTRPEIEYRRLTTPKYASMLKGNDILGKPVIAYGQYQRLASVEDFIFDHNTNQMLAFIIDKPGWRKGARIVPWSGIQSLSADGVIVWSKSMIVIAEQLYRVKRVLLDDNLGKGMPIITQDGRHLGVMTDLYFNEHTGAILGYEVKGGLYADDVNGCSFVPAPQTLRVYKNAAYVPSRTARRMEEHGQSILVVPPSAAHALGRRIRQPLRTEGGSLIAVPGQIVNDAVLALAQAHRKDRALLKAVGLTPTSVD